ncbi:MAG: protein kinase [Phycisphaerales bacterium]
MHTYQYQPGDTPLEGYTIKSAAGHGGFGEVYYAVSDSGREVALKAVQGYEQIELRGIRQCMNLKNPHLVTIFDVKHNAKGQPFVLMEYVAGPSLRDLIDESPGGLGAQKTAFFLREIAKGLSYLHDCGIVHRDLKPANIFFEDGYVKIGDYGLSKAISADHHQSQTVTVGTVHYMAPEVGAGRYDRSIDIYAMGVLVYEMLTGRVPFSGASPSEILMKHLSAKPELDEIEEPFREAINRAMAKAPADRYQSVNEMVETVFSESKLKQSMAGYSGADLSMAAAYAGKKVRSGAGLMESLKHTDPVALGGTVADRILQATHQLGAGADRVSRQIDDQIGGKPPRRGPRSVGAADPLRDPMRPGQRRTLAAIALLVVTLGAGYLTGTNWDTTMWFAVLSSLGAVAGLSIAHSRLLPSLKDEPGIIKRVAYGGMAILGAGLLSAPIAFDQMSQRGPLNATLLTLLVPLFLMDWSKVMSPGRAQRLSIGSAVSAGFLGWIGSLFVSGDGGAIMSIGIPAAIMFAVQALSPFDPNTTEDWALGEDEDESDRPLPLPGPIRRDAHAQPAHTQIDRNAMHKTEKVNAYSNVVTPNHSPKSRLATLLLAGSAFLPFFPVCGLHRFYAGKVGTGILWLLTFGFFWIGQTVDLILIACGSFNDAAGRPITEWHPDSSKTPAHVPAGNTGRAARAHHAAYAPPLLPSFFSIVLSLVATLLIFIGMLVTIGLALEVPEAIAADAFGTGLSGDLNQLFGYDGWPRLFQSAGMMLSICSLVLGGLLLIIARRGEGVMHMVRALLGVGGLFIAALIAEDVVPRSANMWPSIVTELQANRIGPAIEVFLQRLEFDAMFFALMFLVVPILILAWPPRRGMRLPAPVGEGV